jgi:uncharacterized protein YdaU (DUF1376 family)
VLYYYNFNIGDYLKHTAHLTPEEDLAYRRLLDVYYDTETPIPTDIPQVSRRLRVDSVFVQLVLDEFFQLTDEGYRNKRADREIAAYHLFLQKQKANGIKGGRPKTIPKDNPRVSQTEPKITLNENREPVTEKREPLNDNHLKTKAAFIVPDWIPEPAWGGFVESRKASKGAFTDRAKMLIINQLKTMQAEGQDVAAVLDQSVANGWKGVFPLKTQQGANNGKLAAIAENNRRLNELIQQELAGNVAQGGLGTRIAQTPWDDLSE